MAPTTLDVLDLDTARQERSAARAAQRETTGETLPIRLGGAVIAELGPELPLDVFSPLQEINVDFALIIQQAIEAYNAESKDDQAKSVTLVVNLLAANPDLPKELIEAVKAIGARVLGEQGYAAFVGARPSPQDVGALIGGLSRWYGVSLGESLLSPTSSDGGGTSNTTLPTISPGSTPEESGPDPVIPDSSVPAAS